MRPQIGITTDALASVFGPNISTMNQIAPGPPWPTSLGDISVVWVEDSANNQKMAQILFLSPNQMNIYIPPGMAVGPGTVWFPTTGLGPGVGTAALRVVPVNFQKVARALFSASGTGSGVAAATGVRVAIPSQMQSPVPVFLCDAVTSCQAIAIDPGVDAPVYLSFYGTGIRGANSLSGVSVKIGDTVVQPTYAGPQVQIPGLDQVNVLLPVSLQGSDIQ